MSVWSREDDAHDRMQAVVNEHQADAHEQLRATQRRIGEVATLLRGQGAMLTQDELDEVADMLDSLTHTQRGTP